MGLRDENILSSNRAKVITLQLLGWGVTLSVALFLSTLDSKTDGLSSIVMFTMRTLPLLLIYIINYNILIPRLLFKDRRLAFILANGAVIIFLIALVYYLREQEMLQAYKPGRQRPIPIQVFLHEALNHILMVGLVTAVRLIDRLQQSEKALREAQSARVQAELTNLRSQINPHFLLNTLNNIYSLTVIDAEKAQKAIKELSRLLQYVLYDNRGDKVSLIKEIEFLENYIELMRIRLNTKVKLHVEFKVKDNTSTMVDPLLFISLIENAFKHGVSAEKESFIEIYFEDRVSSGEVMLLIINSNHAKSDSDKSGHGIGLEQVRRRLELQYPEAYNWSISCDNGVYKSELTIKV
ncbi:MAG: sensor histidine kinase [Rikenellaceae bacterium]